MRVIHITSNSRFAPLAPSYTTETPIIAADMAWINPNQYLFAMRYSSVGSTVPDTPYAKIIQEADTYLAAKALGVMKPTVTELPLSVYDQRKVNDLIEEYKDVAKVRSDWEVVSVPIAIFITIQKFEQLRNLRPLLRDPFIKDPDTYYVFGRKNGNNGMGKILTAYALVSVYGDGCRAASQELQSTLNMFVPGTGTYVWEGDDGSTRYATYKNGVLHGMESVYYGSGELYQLRNWNAGYLHGPFITKNKRGEVKNVEEYSYGSKVVIKETKYPDGTPFQELRYGPEGKTGIQRTYYPDGSLWTEETWDRGDQTGPSVVIREDGTRTESNWRRGAKTGLSQVWNPEGQLIMEQYYKNGKRDGVKKAWDEHGVLTTHEVYAKDKLVETKPL